jgi:hypothetical protein
MGKPVLIVRSQNVEANLTILRVDAFYANSFCDHLVRSNVEFTRSDGQFEEWGLDRNKERWDVVTNEVAVHRVGGLYELLSTWEIPQPGL